MQEVLRRQANADIRAENLRNVINQLGHSIDLFKKRTAPFHAEMERVNTLCSDIQHLNHVVSEIEALIVGIEETATAVCVADAQVDMLRSVASQLPQ